MSTSTAPATTTTRPAPAPAPEPEASEPHDRRLLHTGAIVAVALLAAATLTWSWATVTRSSASFADQEAVSGNRLGAGTLDIGFGDTTAIFTAYDLAAGDAVNGNLLVRNDGTLPLKYELTSFAPAGLLRDVIDITAWNGSGACPSSAPAGAAVWRPLDARADAPAAPTAGTLAVGATQLVCMRADLPISAPTEAQGRRLDLVIGAAAEHDIEASERGES